MRRSGRNRRRRARGIVKPRPDEIKELLLRAMLHAIFLCLMGLLELLQLVLDGFRSTGTQQSRNLRQEAGPERDLE